MGPNAEGCISHGSLDLRLEAVMERDLGTDPVGRRMWGGAEYI